MTYVISDIHGDYDRYIAMMKKIGLREEEDTLYVLGDVIDIGENGLKILLDMSSRPNVYPIIGEHEYTALPLLEKLVGDISEKALAALSPTTLKSFAAWGKNGGQETVKEFRNLSRDDREWVIEYIEEFAPYEEVTVGDRDFILVHAGLGNFSKSRELSDYSLGELTKSTVDYEKVYFADKYLVTGHKPTVDINPEYKGRIFSLNNHISIDCGSAYGLPLGCLRLDDMKEFYVD